MLLALASGYGWQEDLEIPASLVLPAHPHLDCDQGPFQTGAEPRLSLPETDHPPAGSFAPSSAAVDASQQAHPLWGQDQLPAAGALQSMAGTLQGQALCYFFATLWMNPSVGERSFPGGGKYCNKGLCDKKDAGSFIFFSSHFSFSLKKQKNRTNKNPEAKPL